MIIACLCCAEFERW